MISGLHGQRRECWSGRRSARLKAECVGSSSTLLFGASLGSCRSSVIGWRAMSRMTGVAGQNRQGPRVRATYRPRRDVPRCRAPAQSAYAPRRRADAPCVAGCRRILGSSALSFARVTYVVVGKCDVLSLPRGCSSGWRALCRRTWMLHGSVHADVETHARGRCWRRCLAQRLSKRDELACATDERRQVALLVVGAKTQRSSAPGAER